MQWYAIPPLIFSVLCLYVGIYHLWLYVRRKNDRVNLSFGVASLLMSAVNFTAAFNYNAPTVQESLLPMRLSFIAVTLFSPAFLNFIFELVEKRKNKIYYVLVTLNLITGLSIIAGESALTITTVGAVPKHIEWLGITYSEPNTGIILDIWILVLLIQMVYCLILLLRKYRDGNKYLMPAVISVLFFFVTAISDMLVLLGVYSFMYALEWGFIVMIINMAYTLLNKFIALYGEVEKQRTSLDDYARQLEEKNKFQENLNKAFKRFVPHEFISFLNKKSITEVSLGDQVQKEMTVLFSDIRSFSTLSESMTPEENFNFINSYLSRMSPIIREHNGFIDKYIGDAVMALFPSSPEDAVKAAVDMRKELQVYNRDRIEQNYEPIDMGIGIHTGSLMLGTVGESERMEGTVISGVVNLAARLESATKETGASVIISEETKKDIEPSIDLKVFNVRYLGKTKVKGKEQAISLYEIFDGDTTELKEEKLKHKVQFEKAIELFNSKKYNEAKDIFQKIWNQSIPDKTISKYLKVISAK